MRNLMLLLGMLAFLFVSCGESSEYRTALIETEFGNIKVQLSNATPLHRDNFVKLVEEGFYDDLLFHRVIDGFMIQGGDPTSKGAALQQPLGMGGPGYTIPAELEASLPHVKGALAAARLGDAQNPEKASSGSQFYLVTGRPVTAQMLTQIQARTQFPYTPEQIAAYEANGGTPQLDGGYTVFGQVVEGLEVMDKIAKTPTGQANRPVTDVKMKITMLN